MSVHEIMLTALGVVMTVLSVVVLATCVWIIAGTFRKLLQYRKAMRERITIVRGLHQQDEDLGFPTEFAKQAADADKRTRPEKIRRCKKCKALVYNDPCIYCERKKDGHEGDVAESGCEPL